MLFSLPEKSGTYPGIIMKPDFTLTRTGYLAKDPDGKIYFYDVPPEKTNSETMGFEWIPYDFGDNIFIKKGGLIADLLDESTVYPVRMIIIPRNPVL